MKKVLLLFITLVLFGRALAQIGHYFPANLFSSSMVADLCQDKYGNVWVATDYGLNRFDGYRFTQYLHEEGNEYSICNSAVVSLLCDRDGQLWVGTNRGLDRYCAATDAFVHYTFPDGIQPRVPCIIQQANGTVVVGTAGYGAFEAGDDQQMHPVDIYTLDDNDHYFVALFVDSKQRVWKGVYNNNMLMVSGAKKHHFLSTVGAPIAFVECDDDVYYVGTHGLMKYSGGAMKEVALDMSVVGGQEVLFSSATTDASGNIYIGTRGSGLFRLPSGSRRLERVDAVAYGVDLNTAKVSEIMFDRMGNLWLGLQRKGIILVPQRPLQFSNWSFSAQRINLGSSITSVCEGDGDIIWTTVQGVGVYGFDSRGHVVAHPQAPAAVEFIFRDRQHRYWLGTDDGLFAYDPSTGRSQLRVTFECDKFNDMTSTDDGNIYISTFSRGFCVYNPATGSIRNYSLHQRDSVKGWLCNDWVMCMMPDRKGMIWLGTASGVSCFDPATESFRTQGWHQLLNGVMCFSICELTDGNIVIGTEKGLYLYDRRKKETTLFPGSEQLQDKAISYIVQANDGDIWCSTSMGLWQYEKAYGHFLGHVNGNGLVSKEYIYGVGLHTDDDVVYFGTSDGLTSFRPTDVKSNTPPPDSLLLTEFLVAGTSINTRTVLNGVQITEKVVTESSHFYLSYLDNTFTLVFSQLNFDAPGNVNFEYRVNGGSWIRTEKGMNYITLSHMQPGTYHIEARALAGDQASPVRALTVTIRAPWYLTTWAYLCYLLLALALLAYILLTYQRRSNQRLNEEKMKFLINTTHDIRSPLTLIMSPLANLKRRLGNERDDCQRDIETIEHNAKRVLNLVNQILDVRKIDKQQMQLHCQETNIVAFTRGIYKMYEYNALERHIDFKLKVKQQGEWVVVDGHQKMPELPPVWIDRNQFDKVVTNLLSNAFKYSYDNGTVDILLSETEQGIQLQVADSGVGLDNDSLKHIFDRFFQGSNSRRLHIDGTGIGLNLCKMIVDMHHGTIEAQNRTDSKGSIFTVTLPLGNGHLAESEIEKSAVEMPKVTAQKPSQSKYRVLIVDDDLEIAHYIATELGHYYKFGICSNGKEGLKELLTNEYDVVISDVMMSEMDGFTMLRMIKTNLNISHIPVIMLTSKADVGNRLEGLERGADAFLAKPFDMEELHMNIENLIHTMLRLKGKFSGAQQQADKVEQREVKGNDEILMERIMKAVNKNLSNSDFNVDMLTQEVGISRAQLHRKMKEITGISTSEFIRNIRLEQAARLLREQKVNVTQVAYTVGFSNLAHFSTIFRKHFGVAPSEYAGQKEAEGRK